MDESVYRRMAALERRHWWFVARRQIVQALLRHFGLGDGSAGRRVLEVGSGTGGNLPWLSRFGLVSALEPEPLARALCAEATAVVPLEGRLPGPLPFAREQFGLICALDVIEHVEDDAAAVAALAELLTPEGWLLLTVPALPGLWSHHDHSHHHHRRYQRGRLLDLLQQAGLEVRYCSYYNCWLLPLIAAARALGRWRGGETTDERLPPGWLNGCLRAVFASERWVLGWGRLPLGVSLVALAKRRHQPQGGKNGI
ncbi:class I SAM-dependent methyltransferase [Motiliproteus sediminis]|uniref:class I SAM-dependent methyltransferase n=1 Tax=Motiliproteus sediminis TaxID=1468178 RepID=UPI001AEFAD96|nr:methyltransferase domain-containing protein [Motiliproteus sediminis]